MMSQPNEVSLKAEYQRRYREAKRKAGFKAFEVWVHPEDWPRVKRSIERLAKRRKVTADRSANTEIGRRLAGMTPALIEQVKRMIREGYGAAGIAQNSPATLKQANAMFALVQESQK